MDVKYLREKGGWSVNIFAQIVGVTPTTVYRWEREPEQTKKIESLQRAILILIDQNPITLKQGEHIDSVIRVNGGLSGLYELLKICEEHQHRLKERNQAKSRT
jgi:DNA-binding XRE family transcriptional regulator